VLRQLIISGAAFSWLASASIAAGSEPSNVQRGGPWVGQERNNAETGLPEYFAMSRSIDGGDFWVGLFCLEDKRVYLSLLKNDSEFSGPAARLFSVEIRFDDGLPYTIDAKFVTSHIIAVDPEASKAILVALIHSQMIGVSISGSMKGGRKGSFGVQPYAPALSKIIGACGVTDEAL
jgi:hypothetical protein